MKIGKAVFLLGFLAAAHTTWSRLDLRFWIASPASSGHSPLGASRWVAKQRYLMCRDERDSTSLRKTYALLFSKASICARSRLICSAALMNFRCADVRSMALACACPGRTKLVAELARGIT